MDNTLFSKFTPKESKFFPLLSQLSQIIIHTADLMIENLRLNNHASALEYAKKIKQLEREADSISNTVFDELNKTFITPFDREDIHDLANRMDDVLDRINSAAKRISMYNPKSLPDSVLEIALLIREDAVIIQRAVNELDSLKKNASKVKQYCSDLKIIENKADDIYEKFVIDLFEKEDNAIEVIKNKEIMMELEKATDTAESVGKILKTILVKYA